MLLLLVRRKIRARSCLKYKISEFLRNFIEIYLIIWSHLRAHKEMTAGILLQSCIPLHCRCLSEKYLHIVTFRYKMNGH